MALNAIVKKIDDVAEQYRDLYIQKGDQWEIQIIGAKTEADIQRQLEANRKERTAHDATKAALKEATDKLTAFGELTPDQVTALTEKVANFEAAGTPELTKNFEKIVTDRVNAMVDGKVQQATSKLTKQVNDLTSQLGNVAKENEGLKVADQHRTISEAVRAAATAAKVLDTAVPDALMHAQTAFVIQDGKVVTPEGNTPAEWLESRKPLSGHWWPVAKGAGGQGSNDGLGGLGGDNPWASDKWNITAQGAIVRANPTKAAQLAAAANSKVGATAPTKAK